MPNFFYTVTNGQKRGPIDDQQLKDLVVRGIITSETPLETDTGHKGKAGQIKGLFSAASPSPFTVPYSAAVPIVNGSAGSVSRQTFVLLAIFTGFLGVHSFFAKRVVRGVQHIGLTIAILSVTFFASECWRWREINARYWMNEDRIADAGFYEGLYYFWSFVFVAALVGQIIWIIVDVAKTTTDGNGNPMTA